MFRAHYSIACDECNDEELLHYQETPCGELRLSPRMPAGWQETDKGHKCEKCGQAS